MVVRGRRPPVPPPHVSGPCPKALGAVGPGRGAAGREQRGGQAVLLGLGRHGGIAAAAHRAPGGTRELVLAAVAAVGRDRAADPRRTRTAAIWASVEEPPDEPCALAVPALRPSAASVCGPTIPSTASPLARWKLRIARRVCGPAMPSAGIPSACCTAATSTPGATARRLRRGRGRRLGHRPAGEDERRPEHGEPRSGVRADAASRRTASARRARERRWDASQGSGEDRSVVGTYEPRWSSRLRG